MIDPKKTILQLEKETIVLDELSVVDEMNAGDSSSVNASQSREEIDIGYGLPLIKINSYVVKNLKFFRLDLSNKIPDLIFRFTTEDETFLYTSFPKDGDIVCLYIRSTSELYKPIRMDLLVTEVINSFPMLEDEIGGEDNRANATSTTFTIKAQMRIPGIYQHQSKSYKDLTSFEVLRSVAKDLGLGFASNESGTDDKMSWICPNKTFYKFIDDVANSSWKGEEDFFDWWIDQYYVLNFINLRKQLLEKSKDETKILTAIGPERGIAGGLTSDVKPSEIDLPLFFTNDFYYKKYPFFINAYSVKNESGYIVSRFGYSRDLQFYDTKLVSDRPINKYVSYKVEYVTEKDLGPSSILFKGRVNEEVYKKENKKTWIGTQYGENQHKNIQQAQIQNKINKYENFKVYLETQMHSYVPWVYRGQNVPTKIVHASARQAAVNSQEYKGGGQKDPDQFRAGAKVDNKFLSGVYMVMGSYIEYIEGRIKQSFILGKREWVLNDGRGSDPEPKVSKT
jgi:hypothetical protein